MKFEEIVELGSPPPEQELETVARVQDPVHAATASPQPNNEDSDSYDDDYDSDDGSIPESALIDELERAEFEPYTDDGVLHDFAD